MDIALILLLPLVGGHVFATNWLCSRFRVTRDGGQRLYFSAIFYATFCFICALLIRLWLISHPALRIYDSYTARVALGFLMKQGQEGAEYSVVLVAMIAFGIGLVGWFPINLFFHITWATLRKIQEKLPYDLWKNSWMELQLPAWLWKAIKDDDISVIIYTAILKSMPVSITLDNNKVYVGYVLMTPDPCQELKAISLFPLVSGYRDSSNREMVLTTRYEEVYDRILNKESSDDDLEMDDFRLVLPMKRICSISLFDMVAYSHFVKAAKRSLEKGRSKQTK